MAANKSRKFCTRDEVLKEVAHNGENDEGEENDGEGHYEKHETRAEELMTNTSFKARDVFVDDLQGCGSSQ